VQIHSESADAADTITADAAAGPRTTNASGVKEGCGGADTADYWEGEFSWVKGGRVFTSRVFFLLYDTHMISKNQKQFKKQTPQKQMPILLANND
jgi:hypothetical protein